MPFNCDICHIDFTEKKNLVRHQKTKHKKDSNSKTNKKETFKCIDCGKSLSRRDALKRHMKTCKSVKINNIKNTDAGIIGDNNTLELQKNNYDNKTINVHNDVKLIVFGKDGIDNMTLKKLMKILGSKRNVYESVVDVVNFDPECPESHNVYCSDLKSGVGHIYDEDGWRTKRIEEILDNIIDSKSLDLNQIKELMGDNLSKKNQDRIMSAIDEARGAIAGHDGRTYPPGSRKKLKQYIKQILYNKRDMIMKTRKKTSNKKHNKKNTRTSEEEMDEETNEEDSVEEI